MSDTCAQPVVRGLGESPHTRAGQRGRRRTRGGGREEGVWSGENESCQRCRWLQRDEARVTGRQDSSSSLTTSVCTAPFRRTARSDRPHQRMRGQRGHQPCPPAGGPARALDGEGSMPGAGCAHGPEPHSRSGPQLVHGRANRGLRENLSGAIAYHPLRWNLQLQGTRLLKKTQHPSSGGAPWSSEGENVCDWLSLSPPIQTTSFGQSRMLLKWRGSHVCDLYARVYLTHSLVCVDDSASRISSKVR